VRVVSPAIEGKLLYLRHGERIVPVRAGGEIPSRAGAVGSGLDVVAGAWLDSPVDSSYVAPTPQQLYDELDRFHLPPRPDSSWGEWHYFNLVTTPDEWWYITYLVGGEIPSGSWGGQLLVTRRRPDGSYQRFTAQAPSRRVKFETTRADVTIAGSFVRQRNGRYQLHGKAAGDGGSVRIDVTLTPAFNRYFPPVELRDDDLVSGYVVPAVMASASGTICVGSRCERFTNAPAYHDHNWGVWRDVTWEWGVARGSRLSLLYGGIYGPERASDRDGSTVRSPFFLTVVDSLGVKQVLRFGQIDYQGARVMSGSVAASAPERFSLLATRQNDTLRLDVRVVDALGTQMETRGFQRVFLQMRGRFTVAGRLLGETVADSGMGFFETYVTPR
jgi:hypothetical protein